MKRSPYSNLATVSPLAAAIARKHDNDELRAKRAHEDAIRAFVTDPVLERLLARRDADPAAWRALNAPKTKLGVETYANRKRLAEELAAADASSSGPAA